MSKTTICDKCHNPVENGAKEIVLTFSKEKFDLCPTCMNLFKLFIKEAPAKVF